MKLITYPLLTIIQIDMYICTVHTKKYVLTKLFHGFNEVENKIKRCKK